MSKDQRPSYQDSLRAIGRYVDRNVYCHVLVAEIDDGYVARALPGHQSSLRAEGIALPMWVDSSFVVPSTYASTLPYNGGYWKLQYVLQGNTLPAERLTITLAAKGAPGALQH